MGKFKDIEIEVGDFLELRDKRVRLEIEEFHGLPKYVFYVSGKDMHYFRRVIAEIVPMGVYMDVKRLRFWECRLDRVQLPEGF